jgi:hydrogenase nickel incorporation protein HypA/HybF
MHELSIVRDIFSTLEEAYPGRMQDIIKVEIQAGLLCNIQPILIQNAFEAYVLDEKLFRYRIGGEIITYHRLLQSMCDEF